MSAARLARALVAVALLASLAPAQDRSRGQAVTHLLDGLSLELPFDPSGEPPAEAREVFEAVLAEPVFLHRTVGPFELWVMDADGLVAEGLPWPLVEDLKSEMEEADAVPEDEGKKKKRTRSRSRRGRKEEEPEKAPEPTGPRAQIVLDVVSESLASVAGVLDRHLGDDLQPPPFHVVITMADARAKQTSFEDMVALLDWCDGGWGQWTVANGTLWHESRLAQVSVNTWDAMVINLDHALVEQHRGFFLRHGVAYQVLANVVNRLLRRGSWGMVPPWFAQGLIDELDIQSFGEAWVGGDWYERRVAGWSRPGWSGFVPQGHKPPETPKGPPADLAVTVSETGDPWAHRANSGTRHWKSLATDRDSEAPASFAFMAENESFLPRDRAYARAAFHLLLELAADQGTTFFDGYRWDAPTPDHGMPESEPLPALMSRALGGVPAVDALEAAPLVDVLEVLERPDIARRLEELGAADMLAIADHREQSAWLYATPDIEWAARTEIFNLILEAEYYQQLHEWLLIGRALDGAVDASLREVAEYPSEDRDRSKVGKVFWSGLRAS